MKTIDKCVPKLIIIAIEYISGKPSLYTSFKLREKKNDSSDRVTNLFASQDPN